MMRRRAGWLVAVLLLAGPLGAAWLEGVRWYRHDDFIRVVFDVSGPVQYRVSDHLADGYADVILQGDLDRRMAEEVAIGEGGVVGAHQLRKTSTALTWRIQVQGMARLRHMFVDERPFKVALDFYPAAAGTAGQRAAPAAAKPAVAAPKPAVAAPKPAVAAAKPAVAAAKPAPKKEEPIRAEDRNAPPAQPARRASQAGARQAPAPAGDGHGKDATPRAAPEGRPPAKGSPDDPEARYEGLKVDDRRRLLVGELLLQLGDSAGAMAYLEQVKERQPDHPWNRYLLAQAYLSKGDEYRAQALLEPMLAQDRWRGLLEPLLRRISPPDARGVVPGGELAEEDLSYFLGVLRQGGGLSSADLYAGPQPPAASGARSLLPGIVIGATLGLLGFGVAELRRRRQVDQMVRDRIMASAAPREEPSFDALQDTANFAAVSRRVREELEQVMHGEQGAPGVTMPQARPGAFAGLDRDPEPSAVVAGDSLEEMVYRLADQKRSIVEIAEELNLGVDEVRLHLELREQAGRISNE